jgi:predicted Zn-dependent peptidase
VLRHALILAALLPFLLVASAARAGAVGRPVQERRLANGLRVVVSPDPAGVDVSVVVRYDTGARDEPAGLEGLAHLVEHVMFLGSRHVDQGGLLRFLERAGASNVNGVTTIDETVYFETLPPERLELALWLESDRMGYGLDRLDEAGLSRARAEVLNERREKVVETPLGAVQAMMAAELFPSWHPYHHLPLGVPSAIARATLADVRAWVSTWYGPANAVVAIAGKVDPAAAMALADKYFGTLPAHPPPVRPPVPPATAKAATVLEVRANVAHQELRLGWATPGLDQQGDVELDLASAILVDRGAGWLEHLLLGTPRLCTQVFARQQSMALASVFEIRATIADGRSVQQVQSAILAALGRFEAGVTDDEIQRARLVFQHARLFGLESSLGVAQRLAAMAQHGPLPAVYDGQLARYAAITPAAVRHAVHTWLGIKPWVVTEAQPARGRPVEGELAARTEAPW